MPWQVGIDEAGYGPNLGPLVQASFSALVPESVQCLWTHGQTVFRKAKGREDARLLIDDSKKVNEGVNGLAKLERSVLALLSHATELPIATAEFCERYGQDGVATHLADEPWFSSTCHLPAIQPLKVIHDAHQRLSGLSDLEWGHSRLVIRTAEQYNRMLDECELKSNLLMKGVVYLLAETLKLPGNEPIHIAVDKLGGRNAYGPMLQAAFPDGWPRVLRESAADCTYEILGLGRELSITFQPKADGHFFCVAFASMKAKYVREIWMRQFNAFWREKLPGLAPTAGYPQDAVRFMSEIEPLLETLGIRREQVWRRK